MDLSLQWIIRAGRLLLQWVAHGVTPGAMLAALVLGTFAVIGGFGGRLFAATARYSSRSLLEVLALWAMACASTLLWLTCLLTLHHQGLV